MKRASHFFFNEQFESGTAAWKKKWFHIIFESETKAGKGFDILLLLLILASVMVVLMDSVASLHHNLDKLFSRLEWIFTGLFTVEYLVRISILKQPKRYALSMYGVIDLLAILPSYLSLLLVGSQYLMVVRALRLLRVFRILKLTHFLKDSESLVAAIAASGRKIAIFMMFILVLVIILGSVMYMVEGGQGGFVNIPESIYWAIVTLTTVGYGDISPVTPLGKFIASFIMLCGYGIIAVPTGIVTSEITAQARRDAGAQKKCFTCLYRNPSEAKFCAECGSSLIQPGS